MKEFHADFSRNPSFNSVLGLSNTTFDPDNIVGGQMATEAQIQELWEQIGQLESRIDYCCRDIVVWRSYVRVVAENTGIVISDWLDNMAVGTARRALPFTVEFALPHDSTKYFDNRSNYATTGDYSNTFAVRANMAGNAVQVENLFYEKAVGQARDGVAPSGGMQNAERFTQGSDSWPTSTGVNGRLLLAHRTGNDYPLPQLSNTSNINGYYYIYKDATDNKIKIDVRVRNQYAIDEYLALFFIQFVLRKEFAG